MFNKLITYASMGIGAVIANYRGDIGEPSSIGTYQLNVDNSTYANADMIHTTHYHVDWKVDFNTEQLIGSITHDLEVLTDTNILVMDSWGNIISSVEMLHPGSAKCMRDQCSNDIIYSGYPLTWSVDVVNPIIGDQLTINFPDIHKAGESLSVRIWYATNQESQAMSWLKPSQTSGGVLPYIYTQCEDINCRSVAPLMDTPSNRITYSARVIHSNQLVAKMSANETIVEKYNGTHSQTRFRCDIPIPNYLMALAVGDLVYRSTGYRTGVISEPSQIDAIATELEDMGELLDMVEATLETTSGVTTQSSSFLHLSRWVAWKTPSSHSPHPPSSLETSPKSTLPPTKWLTAGLVTLLPAQTGKVSGLMKAGPYSLKERSALLFTAKISLWSRPFWATTPSGLIW